jgi:pectinesterase
VRRAGLAAALVAATSATAAERPAVPSFTVEQTERRLRASHPDIRRLSDRLPDGVTARPGLVYARYGARRMRLDLFQPRGRGPFPAVVLIHGGGWGAGDVPDRVEWPASPCG